ncbi:hypothetical protein [Ottowia oryzae]
MNEPYMPDSFTPSEVLPPANGGTVFKPKQAPALIPSARAAMLFVVFA